MAGGGAKQGAEDKKEKEKKKQTAVERWLTFSYWKPLICSLGFLLVTVEVLAPLLDLKMDFSLTREVLVLCIAIYGMAMMCVFTLDKNAAGMMNLLTVATIGSTMCMLLIFFTVGMKAQAVDDNDPIMLLATDMCGLFRTILRVVFVGVIMDVISKEASVDWGQLAVLAGYLMLGVALSVSGVIGDVLAHVFIRMDNHFKEGDFVIYDGSLVQIVSCGWRHTTGVSDDNQARIYIPNAELTSAALVNQSQDTGREVEVSIPVDLPSDMMDQALKNAWDVLRQTGEEGFTFKGNDGKTYANQFTTDDCAAWIKESCDAIQILLVGKYFFSEPPPFDGEGQPEDKVWRQQDWEHGWYMQVEWFNLALKRKNEKLGQWPFRPDNVAAADESA